jgi:Rha family phage regulatory protein
MTNLSTITTNVALTVIDGKPTTTTRQVAELFNKRHDTVLRALARLDCSTDFHHRNFTEVSYEVKAGNGASVSYKEYTLTRDGFAFLCMGFTGKEAAKWKEAYINEFNRMEAALAPAAPALASPYITPAQQRAIQEAVSAYVQNHQSSYGAIYSQIKTRFKVATYSQLAPEQFNECLVWLEAAPANVAPAALPAPSCASIRTLPIQNLEVAANGRWITPKVMRELRERNIEPIADLIRQVEEIGGDVRSARTAMLGFYSFHDSVETLSGVLGTLSQTYSTKGYRVH